jgi:hypothetical protein
MQNTVGMTQLHFWWHLFHVISRKLIKFIALGPQGGESIGYQEMMQYFSQWGWACIPTCGQPLDAFSHGCKVFSLFRMLNQALTGSMSWFKCLQLRQHIRLLKCISNDPTVHQKHPGDPDGSDSSNGTSNTLTDSYTLPMSQATDDVAYILPWVCAGNAVMYTHHQIDTYVTLFAGAAVVL